MESAREPVTTGYWDKIFGTRGWGAYPAEDMVRFIARNFGARPEKSGISVLEIGCGPGPNLWYLVREGYFVAGIDGSPIAIRQAKERLEAEELPTNSQRVDLRVGNFSDLPWQNLSFDAVVDVEALYANRLAVINKAVSEIRRVLKPGGLFFGKMFGTKSTGSSSGICVEPGTILSPSLGPCAGNDVAHFFSSEEIRVLFSQFSEVAVEYVLRTEKGGEMQIFEWLVYARK